MRVWLRRCLGSLALFGFQQGRLPFGHSLVMDAAGADDLNPARW